MNRNGRRYPSTLKNCRVCGMDTGERMVTESFPEKFFVVCLCCGFKTRPHKTQNAATFEWNGGKNGNKV